MPRVATKEPANLTKEQVAAAVLDSQTVMVEIPMGDPPSSRFPIHVNMQLDPITGTILRRIAKAYDLQQAKLRNGTRVVNATTALRKILEDIEDANTDATDA